MEKAIKKHQFLIINTFYRSYLSEKYKKNPSLKNKKYDQQLDILTSDLSGIGDSYSQNLKKLGHDANEVIYNNFYLQKQLVKENNPSLNFFIFLAIIPYLNKLLEILKIKKIKNIWFDLVLEYQIKKFRPSIIYNQDLTKVSNKFLKKMKKKYPFIKMIIGQHASKLTKEMDSLESYDLILSAVKNLVKYFREKGVNSEYFKLGFEDTILNYVKEIPVKKEVTFIGGLSESTYPESVKVIDALAKEVDSFSVYGYYDKSILKYPNILKKHKGAVFGKDMYNKLLNSKITINRHSDNKLFDDEACNMRLYEATGIGTLLITDNKKGISELFIPNKEVVVYKSPEDCVEKVKYYLTHEKERKKIALAGQKRTLKEHTYFNRMKELLVLIEKYNLDKL